jgi:hypothetical protein
MNWVESPSVKGSHVVQSLVDAAAWLELLLVIAIHNGFCKPYTRIEEKFGPSIYAHGTMTSVLESSQC